MTGSASDGDSGRTDRIDVDWLATAPEDEIDYEY
jgi:hypothetical protein